jgi:hypothetical protein
MASAPSAAIAAAWLLMRRPQILSSGVATEPFPDLMFLD